VKPAESALAAWRVFIEPAVGFDEEALNLQQLAPGDQAITASIRIVAFDRARTFITLFVQLHHSVVNYTHFGNGDKARWLGSIWSCCSTTASSWPACS
jgi:hypothetical protein